MKKDSREKQKGNRKKNRQKFQDDKVCGPKECASDEADKDSVLTLSEMKSMDNNYKQSLFQSLEKILVDEKERLEIFLGSDPVTNEFLIQNLQILREQILLVQNLFFINPLCSDDDVCDVLERNLHLKTTLQKLWHENAATLELPTSHKHLLEANLKTMSDENFVKMDSPVPQASKALVPLIQATGSASDSLFEHQCRVS